MQTDEPAAPTSGAENQRVDGTEPSAVVAEVIVEPPNEPAGRSGTARPKATRAAKTTKPTRTPRAAKGTKSAKPSTAPKPTAEVVDRGQDDDEENDGGTARGGDGEDVVEAEGEIVEDGGEEHDHEDGGRAGFRDADVFSAARRAGAEAEDEFPVSSGAALSRTDPLQAYLREVQRYALLTPTEEKELTVKYAQTGDVKIAARLVTANLRLVVKLAYEYRRAYKNIMDLIQEGNIGLMQAVKRFDPYRGVKLSSYSAWWIRAYILRFILNNWRLVKLGTTQAQRKLFFNLNKEKAKLTAMGIDPTPTEIAKRLDVEEHEVIDMDRRLSSGESSLDAPAGDAEGRTISRVELIPGPSESPETYFETQEVGHLVHQRLAEFRKTLTGKEVDIFEKRLTAEDPMTLQELGNAFGISRERVRQLEARLTQRLREYLREELGDAVEAH
ncbi:RNA polymerase factor sigma-32 [Chondromyces crocatus]|uniref:RNA polymerase sigma-70 domain-containing protein n=1 Tax=Chondromyces crocatus TaxID=52 RepID=A0A0K1E623_CHOCO|nr:RNA polymerase factor sigma-32 [Chondromyces crocatus]AKT36331.1 uncharacterized protein CMC5_004450 [Chondromyces crocatus]